MITKPSLSGVHFCVGVGGREGESHIMQPCNLALLSRV